MTRYNYVTRPNERPAIPTHNPSNTECRNRLSMSLVKRYQHCSHSCAFEGTCNASMIVAMMHLSAPVACSTTTALPLLPLLPPLASHWLLYHRSPPTIKNLHHCCTNANALLGWIWILIVVIAAADDVDDVLCFQYLSPWCRESFEYGWMRNRSKPYRWTLRPRSNNWREL
jgi:hypothetical protein